MNIRTDKDTIYTNERTMCVFSYYAFTQACYAGRYYGALESVQPVGKP